MLKFNRVIVALVALHISTLQFSSASLHMRTDNKFTTESEETGFNEGPEIEKFPQIIQLDNAPDESLIYSNDHLKVRKTLIETSQVGENSIYEISVNVLKNIDNLWIEEVIPSSYKIEKVIPNIKEDSPLVWNFKALKAGDTQTIVLNLRPIYSGTHELKTLVRMENSINLALFSGQPKLELKVVEPQTIERNGSAAWKVTLMNTGTAVAKSVKLTAQFSEAFKKITPSNYNLDTLDVGATRTFNFVAQALNKGLFENNFKASYANSIPETEALVSATTEVVQSGIEIETSGPLSAYVFKPNNYKIYIRNTGNTDLENIRITQILSKNYSVIDSGRGRINGNAIGWMVPRLPAGSNQLITTKLTSNRPGDAIVKTILKTGSEMTASDQTATKWLAVPGVTLSIVDSKDPITIGETTELSIRVRNQGEFEPVKGQIEISFSKHLKPLSILNAVEGTISGNSIFIPSVLLQPGKDVIVNIAAEGIQMGSGRTNLNFMADFLNNPVINQESTNIY